MIAEAVAETLMFNQASSHQPFRDPLCESSRPAIAANLIFAVILRVRALRYLGFIAAIGVRVAMPTGVHFENSANLLLGAPGGAAISYDIFGLTNRYFS
ncbi:hypothetical protein [Paraburkholderia tropica]|nr:hypothetical protein [Paraburkholderia tropica]MBB6319412.1 hypothetical protein [Paraburkholderia tropica]